MKKNIIFLLSAFVLVFASCEKQDNNDLLRQSGSDLDLKNGPVLTFTAHLSGGQEVPPNDSQATGQAIFRLSADGTELHYRLIVANLENLTASHIHVAEAGFNGTVVAFLYAGPISGFFSGVLAEGVITSGNLVGPLAGHPLEDLVNLMLAGSTYTNVHTTQFPGGEIRGQI